MTLEMLERMKNILSGKIPIYLLIFILTGFLLGDGFSID